jgi:hypothetical protein
LSPLPEGEPAGDTGNNQWGDEVGAGGAVVATDQVQAEVDPGAHAGRGEDLAFGDEEHLGVDRRRRVPGRELVGQAQCVAPRRPSGSPPLSLLDLARGGSTVMAEI